MAQRHRRAALLLCAILWAGLVQVTPGAVFAQVPRAHVLQYGETLASVGARYGIAPWTLARENDQRNPWHARAGQRLVLPTPAAAGPFVYRMHAVRRGETVTSIARRYGVDAWALARANDCWQGWLVPGQWLLIPGQVVRPPVPTATPTPTPTATPTPTSTRTRSVLRTPRPTRRPAPTNTPAPAWQYTQDGPVTYTSNPGLTRILGIIRDDAGTPVNGVLVQCCTNQCWTSKPSGSCGPGCYDFALGDWSRHCKWLVTIVDKDGNALSPSVLVHTTDEGWMSIATLNWRKHW